MASKRNVGVVANASSLITAIAPSRRFASDPSVVVPAAPRPNGSAAARSRKDNPLTKRLKPSEALWLRKNPLIIGLVSVLIGSTDLEQIETFCASAILRGRKILNGTLVDADQNSSEIWD